MSSEGQIVSVNVSRRKGTGKNPVASVTLDGRGIVGDAHAGSWHRQVSMLGQESIDLFIAATGKPIRPGDFAENLTVRGIDFGTLGFLDRFDIGGVELELTQFGKECHGDKCDIFREVGKCVMPREGVFCRVLRGGVIRPGDAILCRPKRLRFEVITLSDRACAGEYADRSGPRARELLEHFLASKRWHTGIDTLLLPDEAELLVRELRRAVDGGVDVVFTLGSTGIGPRDIAPEAVTSVCDRIIPGIMESIRAKFGARMPWALLSRSVAGTAGKTLVFALPGSPRAVEDYLAEILKSLEHALFMIHGLDIHPRQEPQ